MVSQDEDLISTSKEVPSHIHSPLLAMLDACESKWSDLNPLGRAMYEHRPNLRNFQIGDITRNRQLPSYGHAKRLELIAQKYAVDWLVEAGVTVQLPRFKRGRYESKPVTPLRALLGDSTHNIPYHGIATFPQDRARLAVMVVGTKLDYDHTISRMHHLEKGLNHLGVNGVMLFADYQTAGNKLIVEELQEAYSSQEGPIFDSFDLRFRSKNGKLRTPIKGMLTTLQKMIPTEYQP